MVYLLDVTKNCEDSSPMRLSGNALDPATFKLTCECGTKANVFSVREVGLDPSSPDFQGRVEATLAEFTSLSYYVVTVTEGVMTAEPRWRTQVRIEFHTVAECKTCGKKMSGDTCSQKELNDFLAEHKAHDLSTNTFVNSTDPRVLKMVEQSIKNQQKSRSGG